MLSVKLFEIGGRAAGAIRLAPVLPEALLVCRQEGRFAPDLAALTFGCGAFEP